MAKLDARFCITCHNAHRYDTQTAAVDACMSCHNDEHTKAYTDSPHYRIWQEALAKGKTEQGVSCATCHLPRIESRANGETIVTVQHNQNDNLRPNEKMIRSACLHCHGLGYSIDTLADPALIQNNFQGDPAKHIKSIDMALARDRESRKAE